MAEIEGGEAANRKAGRGGKDKSSSARRKTAPKACVDLGKRGGGCSRIGDLPERLSHCGKKKEKGGKKKGKLMVSGKGGAAEEKKSHHKGKLRSHKMIRNSPEKKGLKYLPNNLHRLEEKVRGVQQ